MKILVTGATGFVGKNLIKRMRDEHELHILVRPQSRCDSVGVERRLVMDSQDDISIPRMAEYLRSNGIEGIIHLASLYVAEHESGQIRDLVLSNVYLGTALLEATTKAGVRWFLNTGTIWQNFNAPDGSDLYNPVNLYAASKQAFMTMARYYTETCGLRFCTLKLCDTYGEGDTRRKIMALFKDIAASGRHLDMSPGEQRLDLLHIDDVVDGFVLLAKKLSDGAALRDEYVLSSGQQTRLKDLARMFEEANKVRLDITWGGRPYRKREVMTPYKGNVLEGWKPKHDITTAL